MSNIITPKIIRVKEIVTPVDLFEDDIDMKQVDRIAELLLLSNGMLLVPIVVQRIGHDSKYQIVDGYESYVAALTLNSNKNFKGKINAIIVGTQFDDAPIELIQKHIDVLKTPSKSTPIDNDNEMGKNDLEKIDFDRIDPPSVNKMTKNKPVSKPVNKPLSAARRLIINCLKAGLGRAREIATELHKTVGAVRAMLAKLVKADLGVMRIRRGLYAIRM